ncbi:MAG: menaquinone biosynthesis decarboxylase [Acidobacteriota bacterium]|nr:menaquinone biosynthesis decarboxylase [Acidobacteriota bacterium]
MAYADLNQFVSRLRELEELRDIEEEVDPILEISEIADRVVKKEGPALLFRRPKGHKIPVLINTFGSERRMCLALETESFDHLAQRIHELLTPEIPEGMIGKLRALPKLAALSSLQPNRVRSGACQEVVETTNPSLSALPILKCWPMDAGPYITLPLVITRDPENGSRNVGMYRLQVFDERTLGLHWQLHKGSADHYRKAEARNERLEVAIALGPDPALIYAASAPLPDDVDELMLAGFLRKQPVDVVRCKTVNLEVPANAQIVLEGYAEPGERRMEGPFGDHTGFYSLAEPFPVFHLTAVTMCRQPIYPTIIVGRPPMEDGPMGTATVRVFLPAVRKVVPEIVDMHLPVEGIFHNLAIVSIRKRYPGHARKIMHGLWGLGQLMFSKIVVVVDHDCNIHDPSEVLWRVGTAIDPKRDVLITEGPVDHLDFASSLLAYGGKMGIDATRKGPDEGFTREWPPEIKMSPEVKERVDRLWPKLGLG